MFFSLAATSFWCFLSRQVGDFKVRSDLRLMNYVVYMPLCMQSFEYSANHMLLVLWLHKSLYLFSQYTVIISAKWQSLHKVCTLKRYLVTLHYQPFLLNFFKKGAWPGSCKSENFWLLNANSFKLVKATDFRFSLHVPLYSPDSFFQKGAFPGSGHSDDP